MSFAPTDEQQAIYDAFIDGGSIVIQAGAGTGKTTTLRGMSELTDRKGIYIAYNKSVQTEAESSFPKNVLCKTAHALAFKTHAVPFISRLNGPRVPAWDAAKYLGITEGIGEGATFISQAKLARFALDTVQYFCYSADDKVLERHVPKVPGVEDYEDAFRYLVHSWAVKAWDDITSKNGHLKFEHDHYLKMFAMDDPKLDCDFVMLDEAQDANPVIAQIVEAQNGSQRIMVGDTNQAIYGWRGAIDAMEKFNADHTLFLQKSFRFGPAVADEANKWLTLLDAQLRIEGHEPVGSTVGEVDPLPNGAAILCRTNGEVMAQAISAQTSGRKVAIVGGAKAFAAYAEAAISLMAGKGTWHHELQAFQTWAAVQEYCADEPEAAGQLKTIVRMIDTYGPHRIIEVANNCEGSEGKADLILSTAHKAKGREWETVRIGGDFGQVEAIKVPSRPDMMLAYVAVTRAKKQLDNLGLAWVDQILGMEE